MCAGRSFPTSPAFCSSSRGELERTAAPPLSLESFRTGEVVTNFVENLLPQAVKLSRLTQSERPEVASKIMHNDLVTAADRAAEAL